MKGKRRWSFLSHGASQGLTRRDERMCNSDVKLDRIERIEHTVMELVVRALADYFDRAVDSFQYGSDKPEDIAEDVMRDAVEEMGVSKIHHRLGGKVDFKKALYAFLPEPCPVALMLDAKAEDDKERAGDIESVNIQLSQTSMTVLRPREPGSASDIAERGKLGMYVDIEGKELLTVTIIAKYIYATLGENIKALTDIKVACIPNGMLQSRYNPTPCDTIWRAGKGGLNVRVSYGKLQSKAAWRVREITAGSQMPLGKYST